MTGTRPAAWPAGATDAATLAHRVDTLAAFLTDRGLRAEARAAANIAASLRALAARGPRLCPICKHRHSIATPCCTLCGWQTVRR